MTYQSLLKDDVTIYNLVAGTGGADNTRYGDDIPTYDGGTAAKAWVQELPPLAGAEETEKRDTRTTRFLIFLLPTAVINGTSHVLWEGRTLIVEGEPAAHKDQNGAHHIEAQAKEVLG